MDLNRFIIAHHENFERAFAEIKSGKKTSHWMWYIFPQLEGLGTSPMAKNYAIKNLVHARLFLENPILGRNLVKITEELLKAKTTNPTEIMGSIDDLKLKSCMTLFANVDSDITLFNEVISKFYDSKQDQRTLELLGIVK
jgi:uncharacterized protein (DUF1810 family)